MRIQSYVYLLIVLALAGISGFTFTKLPYNFGLDIKGGVRISYQMDLSKLTDDQKQNMTKIHADLQRILNNRVQSALGVVEGSVFLKGVDQLVVELPGATDVDEARRVLGSTAKIQFYHARTVSSPRFQMRKYDIGEPKPYLGVNVYEFFQRNQPDKTIKPGTAEYKEMIQSWGQPILEGVDLKSASVRQEGAKYQPLMEFSTEGSRKMETWSRRYPQENIAAVLDNQVLSIAAVREGVILSDNAYIDGDFDPEFVRQLIDLLNAGALPVDLVELSSQVVDPTIGEKALDQIVKAGIFSIAFTALFVIVYYLFPGIVALAALLLYILFTLTVLKLINATFSLAAVAGLILSIGMAVDANILIFERIKEELRAGKQLKSAIDLGFKRALSAIVDSNACTILTSLVLLSIGTGPVKGFASTLIIGVAISLFTAVTVTRWILKFLVGAGIGTNPAWYGLSRQWFGEKLESDATSKPLQIIEKRNRYFAISILSIVIPGIFFFMGGLKPNVEFMGGYEATYLIGNKTKADVDKVIEQSFKGGNSKIAQAGGDRLVIVTIPQTQELEGKSSGDAHTIITEKLGYTDSDKRGFSSVGPTVQKEAIQGAIRGIIFSTLLIVIYLGIRFGIGLGGFKVGLRFSLAAIGALLHDILVVVALAAMFGYLLGWEVSALFITSMLTVVGFSTHDTIVIFDRIRENLRRPLGNEDISNLINRSITQSIARSINTSFTVIVSLGILIGLGSATPDLRFFNAIMLCGIVSGTYSSIFNASPILYLVDRFFAKKGDEHTLLGISRRELAHIHAAPQVVSSDQPTLESQAYGQVKRRASAAKRSEIKLDDEP